MAIKWNKQDVVRKFQEAMTVRGMETAAPPAQPAPETPKPQTRDEVSG